MSLSPFPAGSFYFPLLNRPIYSLFLPHSAYLSLCLLMSFFPFLRVIPLLSNYVFKTNWVYITRIYFYTHKDPPTSVYRKSFKSPSTCKGALSISLTLSFFLCLLLLLLFLYSFKQRQRFMHEKCCRSCQG